MLAHWFNSSWYSNSLMQENVCKLYWFIFQSVAHFQTRVLIVWAKSIDTILKWELIRLGTESGR